MQDRGGSPGFVSLVGVFETAPNGVRLLACATESIAPNAPPPTSHFCLSAPFPCPLCAVLLLVAVVAASGARALRQNRIGTRSEKFQTPTEKEAHESADTSMSEGQGGAGHRCHHIAHDVRITDYSRVRNHVN
mmetsp:Transcript_21992/g.65929  ORF Transcript_21992/g.65929 Transcript_21992/m.65929 type:complete len:133 (+) Transcript_21992:3549-3947(+)